MFLLYPLADAKSRLGAVNRAAQDDGQEQAHLKMDWQFHDIDVPAANSRNAGDAGDAATRIVPGALALPTRGT